MARLYLLLAIMLPPMLWSAGAAAQPGCLFSFDGAASQYKQDGKILPGSYNERVVRDCMPVFQSICGDPAWKTQINAPAPYQYGNSPKASSKSIDNFCKAIKPQ